MQIPVAVADLLTFLEASVLYALSVAEVHGVNVEDIERRRFLVTSVLVGNSAATTTLESLIGRTGPYWGKKIVESIPMSAIKKANAVLGPRFVTKYGAKQGVLVLGKQIPMFIGVGIGGGGNSLVRLVHRQDRAEDSRTASRFVGWVQQTGHEAAIATDR